MVNKRILLWIGLTILGFAFLAGLLKQTVTVSTKIHEPVVIEESSNQITINEKVEEQIQLTDSTIIQETVKQPVTCSFEYAEDLDFNKYIVISVHNNTDEIIRSVQLNVTFSPYQSQLDGQNNAKLTQRVTIKPGQYKKIRYDTPYNIDDISVVKYNGSKSGTVFNGYDAMLKENRRILNEQLIY